MSVEDNTSQNNGISETNHDTMTINTPSPKLPDTDQTEYTCTIQCAIRRKPKMTALPGQDPNERIYRLGACLDRTTRGNLKGISGELEHKFMPEIVGVSPNDPTYRKSIENYWASFSRIVPADEEFLKEHERGVKVNITFRVIGKARKERFESILNVEEKLLLLNKAIEQGIKTGNTVATVDANSVADYLLLNFAIKHPRVANNFEVIHKAVKIEFYIFEKALSIKNQLSFIDMRKLAMDLYQGLTDNERLVDGILLEFQEKPKNYDNLIDKLIRIDVLYNASKEAMAKFIKLAQDNLWEIKYIINKAIDEQRLKRMPNSTAIYYNDLLLGMDIDSAALMLRDDAKGNEIKENLKREINLT